MPCHDYFGFLCWCLLYCTRTIGSGEAYYQTKDLKRAHGCFRESDTLAVHNDEKHTDILFLNAYYEWKMASAQDNPTRTKIALGRLKLLRSSLERRFPEVEEFDRFVERRRAHA